MISKFKDLFVILGVVTLALAACGGPTFTATHDINKTEVPIASATETLSPSATLAQTSAETDLVSVGVISYVNDVLPILKSRCGSCHGTNNPREGLIVTTYVGLMAGSKNGLVVIPNDPENSILIKQIRDGEMPKRGPKLTLEQLQILVDWILQGALNN